tara:strand:+ start:47 stop:628 length:582 start_codon:yes stop_codon:yes gene_type:complete
MQEILLFLISSLALTLMPGPDILFVINQSVVNKKYGIITSLGLCSGLVFHTMFLVFGVSAIIQLNNDLILYLKYFGAFYVLYLGFIEFKSNIKSNENIDSKIYLRGLYMNLINPKVLLFFLAYFPNFLFSDSIDISVQFLILGCIFIFQALIVFISISLLSNRLINYVVNIKNISFKYFKFFIYVIICMLILL